MNPTFPHNPHGLNQQVPDQEAYARALAEDERYRTLAESLTRARICSAGTSCKAIARVRL